MKAFLDLTVVGLLDQNKLEANMAEFVKDQVNTLSDSAKNSLDRVSTTMINHQTLHGCFVNDKYCNSSWSATALALWRGIYLSAGRYSDRVSIVTYLLSELLAKFWQRLGKRIFGQVAYRILAGLRLLYAQTQNV
jgi:hypothetical protein